MLAVESDGGAYLHIGFFATIAIENTNGDLVADFYKFLRIPLPEDSM